MCGLFGIINTQHSENSHQNVMKLMLSHAQRRGSDASGYALKLKKNDNILCFKDTQPIKNIFPDFSFGELEFVAAHARLATNDALTNQPITRSNISVFHNGIILNAVELSKEFEEPLQTESDTEVLLVLAEAMIQKQETFDWLSQVLNEKVAGTVSCAIVFANLGKIFLYSNHGNLFWVENKGSIFYCSEQYPFIQSNIEKINTLCENYHLVEISNSAIKEQHNSNFLNKNHLPKLMKQSSEASQLIYIDHKLRRCAKCILPETMPYIKFNKDGICNYCENYKKRNLVDNLENLKERLNLYRTNNTQNVIVPMSGGRDSCYCLHLTVNELDLRPVTYTYDWGMVTDLARRNISRMCSDLKVENIVVSADIRKKRDNIRKNLIAWLNDPQPGMLSILTAGDKHFFKYIEKIKMEKGIKLNLWGINPLETTHFKSGFLGVAPSFYDDSVYRSGLLGQLNYHSKRLRYMLRSTGYINSSLFDTYSGEYYRSIQKKTDYYELFNYTRWNEEKVNSTLQQIYNWEVAVDTDSTWRIGDGTAAFYNYAYYTMCGFTEHDTFRSNQIREGDLSREEALSIVKIENQPRYSNIKWYCDVLELNFNDVISVINANQLRR